MVRVGDLLKPLPFHPAFKDRGQGWQKVAISFSDLPIKARHDVEACSSGLSEIETNDGNIGPKDCALAFDVISEFFNLVFWFFKGLSDRITEPVRLLQDKGLIEVLLVFEELVKCSGGKFGFLGDTRHGDTRYPFPEKSVSAAPSISWRCLNFALCRLESFLFSMA